MRKPCVSSPIEASSGKTTRHRLNQGGNREANNALWRIVMVRLTCDPDTRAYRDRRQKRPRNHPLPQTLRRTRNVPAPHKPTHPSISAPIYAPPATTPNSPYKPPPNNSTRGQSGSHESNVDSSTTTNSPTDTTTGYTPKKPLDTNRSISFGSTGPSRSAATRNELPVSSYTKAASDGPAPP